MRTCNRSQWYRECKESIVYSRRFTVRTSTRKWCYWCKGCYHLWKRISNCYSENPFIRASTPPTHPSQDTNIDVTHIVYIEGCTSLSDSSKAAAVSHSKDFVDSCEHADAHNYEEIPDFPQKSKENQTHDGTFPVWYNHKKIWEVGIKEALVTQNIMQSIRGNGSLQKEGRCLLKEAEWWENTQTLRYTFAWFDEQSSTYQVELRLSTTHVSSFK